MSLLASFDDGWVISHGDFVKDMYKEVVVSGGEDVRASFTELLFKIDNPFLRDNQKASNDGVRLSKKRKTSLGSKSGTFEEVEFLKSCLEVFTNSSSLFRAQGTDSLNNRDARKIAADYYQSLSDDSPNFYGENRTPNAIVTEFNGRTYIFPPNCCFISHDIRDLEPLFSEGKLLKNSYDFILLDPPWWNKFVRRKRTSDKSKGYKMLDINDLQSLPIKRLLKKDGLVGVWTTNAPSLIESVKTSLFPSWGVTYSATWFWLKVCTSGAPICEFSAGTEKQPYERILFGVNTAYTSDLPERKCILSVPSAIHSHKPPLNNLLSPYLPESPKCLELFARYLLPGWTSIGNQVLSLQHLSLYSVSNV